MNLLLQRLRWRTYWLLGGALALLSLIAGLLVMTPPANALPPDEIRIATYNMQGETADAESKWASDIPRLLPSHDLLTLQEAGPLPDPSDTRYQYVGPVQAPGAIIHWYRRNFGTSSRQDYRHVYFMRTDAGGNRVNLATITRVPAQSFMYVPPQAPVGRGTFGVRFDNTVYFNVHALAGGGGDASNLVAQIAQRVQDDGHGYDYVVTGDFNRSPDTLTIPADAHIYRPHAATQRGHGELDYMVTNRHMEVPDLTYDGRVIGGISSDHFPVEFRHRAVMRASADVSYRIRNLPTSDALGVPMPLQGDIRRSRLLRLNNSDDQGYFNRFQFNEQANGTYVITNVTTGNCLFSSRNSGDTDTLFSEMCPYYPESVQWEVYEAPGEGRGFTIELASITPLGRCLQKEPSDSSRELVIAVCDDSDQQKWKFQKLLDLHDEL